MLLGRMKGHAPPEGRNAPWGETSGRPAVVLLLRISGQQRAVYGLANAESTAQSKKFGEFADVVLVERVVRLTIWHFAFTFAGVT